MEILGWERGHLGGVEVEYGCVADAYTPRFHATFYPPIPGNFYYFYHNLTTLSSI